MAPFFTDNRTTEPMEERLPQKPKKPWNQKPLQTFAFRVKFIVIINDIILIVNIKMKNLWMKVTVHVRDGI